MMNKLLSLSVSWFGHCLVTSFCLFTSYLQHLEMALFAVNQNLSDTILYVQCPQSNIVIITITKIIMNMRWSSAVTRMVVKLWPSRWWFSVKTTVIKKSSLANRRDRDQKEQVLLLAEIGLFQKHISDSHQRWVLNRQLPYMAATHQMKLPQSLHSGWTGLTVINATVSHLSHLHSDSPTSSTASSHLHHPHA